MGSMVLASCDCGYSAEMPLGGGMMNFDSLCAFPAYCRDCREMHGVNLLASPVACRRCGGVDVVPYDDESLVGVRGDSEVFSWRVDGLRGHVPRLTDGRYFCPGCRQMGLRFREAGLWD